METLWLLAKINVVFQIAEKVAYGCIALWTGRTGYRYYKDYKSSVDEEAYFAKKG